MKCPLHARHAIAGYTAFTPLKLSGADFCFARKARGHKTHPNAPRSAKRYFAVVSQENVELWRGSIEDLLACRSEADWEDWLARADELWDPDIEWDVSAYGDMPDIGGVYRGIEAVRRFWHDWLAAWETLSLIHI